MTADIMLTEEILRRTARELKLPYASVKWAYKYIVYYIHKTAQETDACAIELPYFGIMYISYEYVKTEYYSAVEALKKDPQNRDLKRRERNFRNKKLAIEEYLETANRPKDYCNHLKEDKIQTPFYSHGKSIPEMSDVQNRLFKKRMDENQ